MRRWVVLSVHATPMTFFCFDKVDSNSMRSIEVLLPRLCFPTASVENTDSTQLRPACELTTNGKRGDRHRTKRYQQRNLTVRGTKQTSTKSDVLVFVSCVDRQEQTLTTIAHNRRQFPPTSFTTDCWKKKGGGFDPSFFIYFFFSPSPSLFGGNSFARSWRISTSY